MNNTTSVTSLLTASSSAGATLDEETSQNDDMSQDSAAAKDTIKDAVTGLKTADVVLDKEKEVERIGDYPIKDINLSLVRLFMSKNEIEPMCCVNQFCCPVISLRIMEHSVIDSLSVSGGLWPVVAVKFFSTTT